MDSVVYFKILFSFLTSPDRPEVEINGDFLRPLREVESSLFGEQQLKKSSCVRQSAVGSVLLFITLLCGVRLS